MKKEEKEIKNNYFYKSESEQFAFYRIPKLLFTDSRYAGISAETNVLYGLMLDRMSLSVRNNWVDDDNRVYIYFTLEEITEYLSIGKDKVVKLLKELDVIERKKQGLGKPVMIYVLNFTDSQNSIQSVDNSAEVQTSEKPKSGENAEVLTSEIPKSALRKNRTLDFGKSDPNNTDINNTDLNKTDISSSSRVSFAAMEREKEEYRDVIHENLDENSTKICNYKSYILTMLYNAPDTIITNQNSTKTIMEEKTNGKEKHN